MQMLDDIKENIRSFIEENSKLTVALLGMFGLLTVCAVFVLLVYHPGSAKKRKTVPLPEEPFTLKEEFLQPAGIRMTEDYYFSRVTEDSWSSGERERWFTMPDDANLAELRKANDELVNTITEAAP